jgi:hypothetical protein
MHLVVRSYWASFFLRKVVCTSIDYEPRVVSDPLEQYDSWMTRLADWFTGSRGVDRNFVRPRYRQSNQFVEEKARKVVHGVVLDSGDPVEGTLTTKAVPVASVATVENPCRTITVVPQEGGVATDISVKIVQALAMVTERLSMLDRKVENLSGVAPVVNNIYQSVEALPLYSKLPTSDFFAEAIRFLNERCDSILNEAGNRMFGSKTAPCVGRVVSVADGGYRTWATCFKVGADKICTTAHTNCDPDTVEMGVPLVDDKGFQLLCEFRLGDGKVARFPLIPFYRSEGHSRDMILCSMPKQLCSVIPGLRTREFDPELDTECALLGFPRDTEEVHFSCSRVQDRVHMAGSDNGVSGGPILVQGRVTIGVHEGAMSGQMTKRYHSFTKQDLQAIANPCPPPPYTETPFEVQSWVPGKGKKTRSDRITKPLNWADDDGEMDWNAVPFKEQVIHQNNPAPDVETMRAELESLRKLVSLGFRKEKVSTPPSSPPKKRGKKLKSPCPNLLDGGHCRISDAEHLGKYDHKLKSHEGFHSGPAKTGPVGKPNSERSMA